MKEISEFKNVSFKNIRDKSANPQYRIRTLSVSNNFNIINPWEIP
jgi:hypothetical protein